MKVKELKAILDKLNDEEEVMIIESVQSLGGHAKVGIDYVGSGFDWDSGYCLITPKQPMVIKPEDMKVHELAKDLIWYLATSEKKSSSVREARDILKKMGYTKEKILEMRSYFHR